jgi:replicative DNA helicase
MKVVHKCQVVGVDHLHLIDYESRESRADQIRKISGALKSTFKRLGIGGIVLCQLNREGIERPTLRSLREGGAIEQDADTVVMLHSEDYRRRQEGDPFRDHKLEFLLQKNKDGRCADIPFHYDPATFTLASWDDGPPPSLPYKHSPEDFL